MDFPLARAAATTLQSMEQTGSTNDELARQAAVGNVAEFSAVVTLNQTAGRGRLGRAWVAPAGQSVAVSVVLVPERRVARERLGWIPLIAGLAMTRAVAAALPGAAVSLKWPNDVLISDRKVSGLLTDLLPGSAGVVVGAGLNLTIPTDALPVPTATSLAVEGAEEPAEELADRALSVYLSELRALWGAYCDHSGDAESSGILSAVTAECSTLGQLVRVSLPDGRALVGTAVDLDPSGQLRIRLATDASVVAVAAGDVTHLRYE